MAEKCPWSVAPKTIDQLLEGIETQIQWEIDNGPVPYEWNMLITKELFYDIALKVSLIAEKVGV